jgi:hypothetical protein
MNTTTGLHVDTLIATVRAELNNLSQMGQIDNHLIYNWVSTELRRFGALATKLCEDVIEVNSSKAMLPDNCFSLKVAYKCEPFGYEYDHSDETESALLQSPLWRQRVGYGQIWNPCKCSTDDDTIVKNININNVPVKFHYHHPIPLRLIEGPARNECVAEYHNAIVGSSPYEIQVNGLTIYTNFGSGSIYIQYKGIEQDEKGLPIIPDTDLQLLQTHITNHVKKKIFEKVTMNNEDAAGINKLRYYEELCRQSYRDAFSELTSMNLAAAGWGIYKGIRKKNRAYAQSFEVPFMKLQR